MLTRSRLRAKLRPGWDRVKQDVWKRSGGRCEVRLLGLGGETAETHPTRCPERAVDPAHVVRRSTGGKKSRAWLDHPVRVLAACRMHHRWEDAPFVRGKLVHREVDGIVESRVFYDKWAAKVWRLRLDEGAA